MRIQELSVSERIVLAEKLWDSVVDEDAPIELSKIQAVELDRRLQAFLDDQDIGSSWSEVKGRITSKV
ncbi:MAG: addiction module protein [Methylococcales bacterium]|nr:addiction module protein [Methylococcales bacterium]